MGLPPALEQNREVALYNLISLTPRLHPPNLPIFKPNLNTVRMKRALGQKILNHTLRQLAATLIFFQNNHNRYPRRDLFAAFFACFSAFFSFGVLAEAFLTAFLLS